MSDAIEDNIPFTVKIPRQLFEEIELRVPKGIRGEFIREAITEKVRKIPLSQRLDKIEEKLSYIEVEVGELKKTLAELDLLSNPKDKINISTICRDTIDHQIIEFLVHNGGTTTSQLARHLKLNRFLILNRLKRMKEVSERKYGKPSVDFLSIEKMGRKRAWWINEDVLT